MTTTMPTTSAIVSLMASFMRAHLNPVTPPVSSRAHGDPAMRVEPVPSDPRVETTRPCTRVYRVNPGSGTGTAGALTPSQEPARRRRKGGDDEHRQRITGRLAGADRGDHDAPRPRGPPH